MKKVLIIFPLSAMVSAVVFICFLAFDQVERNANLCHDLFTKKECDFKYNTAQYKIVYNANTKRYAVRLANGEFLTDGRLGIENYHPNIRPGADFNDSCKAKRYLHKYILQQNSMIDFK